MVDEKGDLGASLREKVARALAKADRIEICSDASYALSTYGPKADAAIAAVMEALQTPTEAMTEAAFHECGIYTSSAEEVWLAMLGAVQQENVK